MTKNNGQNGKLSLMIPLIPLAISLLQLALYAIPTATIGGESYNMYTVLAKAGRLSLYGPVVTALILNCAAIAIFLFATLYILLKRDVRMKFIKTVSVIVAAFEVVPYILAIANIAASDGVEMGASAVICMVAGVLALAAVIVLSIMDKECDADKVERTGGQKFFEAVKYVPALAFLCFALASVVALGTPYGPLGKGAYADKADTLWSSYPGHSANQGYDSIEPPSWYMYPEVYDADAVTAKYNTVYNEAAAALVSLNKKTASANNATKQANSGVQSSNAETEEKNELSALENAYDFGITYVSAGSLSVSRPKLSAVNDGLLNINVTSGDISALYAKVKAELEKNNRDMRAYNEYVAEYNASVDAYNKEIAAYNETASAVEGARLLKEKAHITEISDWKYVPMYDEYWPILYSIYNTDGKTLPEDAKLYVIPTAFMKDEDVQSMAAMHIIVAILALVYAFVLVSTVITDLRSTMLSRGLTALTSMCFVLYAGSMIAFAVSAGGLNTAFIAISLVQLIAAGVCFIAQAAIFAYRGTALAKHPAMEVGEVHNTLKRCTNRFGAQGAPLFAAPSGPVKGKDKKKFVDELDAFRAKADVYIRDMYKGGNYVSQEQDN